MPCLQDGGSRANASSETPQQASNTLICHTHRSAWISGLKAQLQGHDAYGHTGCKVSGVSSGAAAYRLATQPTPLAGLQDHSQPSLILYFSTKPLHAAAHAQHPCISAPSPDPPSCCVFQAKQNDAPPPEAASHPASEASQEQSATPQGPPVPPRESTRETFQAPSAPQGPSQPPPPTPQQQSAFAAPPVQVNPHVCSTPIHAPCQAYLLPCQRLKSWSSLAVLPGCTFCYGPCSGSSSGPRMML